MRLKMPIKQITQTAAVLRANIAALTGKKINALITCSKNQPVLKTA